jgi:hypothetical protein
MVFLHKKHQERFGDSKGVMRSRKSKDRQHNAQKKKKRNWQATIYKTLQRKLKIEKDEHH